MSSLLEFAFTTVPTVELADSFVNSVAGVPCSERHVIDETAVRRCVHEQTKLLFGFPEKWKPLKVCGL